MTIVSDRLKELRKSKGLSIQEAARKANIFKKRIEEYEANIKVPDYGHARSLADCYHVTLCYLVGHTDDPTEVIDVSHKSNKYAVLKDEDFSEEDEFLMRRSLSEVVHYMEWYKNEKK
ncbi:helix-turn-helix transcriptional regulator [Priestia megaterium]|uniref:Helix-turn-helix family protein n=2 Tax=Priestia megaterium TaxID=1404 RepID=A0A0B6AAJ2_PRIM2|nr:MULTISPECIES: helix-turn-helix transcriptional regulator [Priestia]AJI21930.1 helix-turn-helix family protein [Priestia megaterium NBRC 15308 = ATCC 14581]MDR4230416.1 helix-turn-helix transcriptional regulator [Priestia megaterium]MED3805563.1 helix-turn-helix transcriptional regulator [Priestia megaterium]MED3888189.1 helix-turn-helix transcriptional regulator [Priestia aryabhattai]MED4257738.1 helix-turn-helix transcriptional regulator [Priestia aryabhattai]